MIVKELIEELKTCPQNLKVGFQSYDCWGTEYEIGKVRISIGKGGNDDFRKGEEYLKLVDLD